MSSRFSSLLPSLLPSLLLTSHGAHAADDCGDQEGRTSREVEGEEEGEKGGANGRQEVGGGLRVFAPPPLEECDGEEDTHGLGEGGGREEWAEKRERTQ